MGLLDWLLKKDPVIHMTYKLYTSKKNYTERFQVKEWEKDTSALVNPMRLSPLISRAFS